MDVRWKIGIFVGHTLTTGEHDVGIRNGNAIRVRSCLRLVELSRWDKAAVERIIGIPSAMNPIDDGGPTADNVEAAEKPHDFAEEEVNPAPRTPPADTLPRPAPAGRRLPRDQRASRSEGPPPVIPPRMPSDPWRVRITKLGIDKCGTTPGCRRCADLGLGNQRSRKPTMKPVVGDSTTSSRLTAMLNRPRPLMNISVACLVVLTGIAPMV